MLSGPAKATIAVSTVFSLLAVFAVALRFYARRLKSLPFQFDDYTILLALLITVAICVIYIVGATIGGIGVHIEDLEPVQMILFKKILYAAQFAYLGNVALVRLSILHFYKRIFSTRKFNMVVYFMAVLVCLWFIAFFFATLLQASPISFAWNQMQPGTMIHRFAMYTATAATETFLDIFMLVMPWPVIWALQIKTHHKRIVSGVFLLGGFVCISSVVRLYYCIQYLNPSMAQTVDFTYYLSNLAIWSAIEPCLGVICACLPALGPIFQEHAPRTVLSSTRLQNFRQGHRLGSVQKEKSSVNVSNRSGESMAQPLTPDLRNGVGLEVV